MLILSLSIGWHDNAVVISDDYQILAAIQRERITRIKSHGAEIDPQGGIQTETVAEAMKAAGVCANDIQQVITSRGTVPITCFHLSALNRARYAAKGFLRFPKHRGIGKFMKNNQTLSMPDVIRKDIFLHLNGLPKHLPLAAYNHHYAHALSALFLTDFNDALIYTADGMGDGAFYSAWHCTNSGIKRLFGGDGELLNPSQTTAHSMGQVYGTMTSALGYKRYRHEGKLTGLAAFGEPVVYDELRRHYWVDDDGGVNTDLTYGEMVELVKRLGQSVAPKDAAASVQKLLEDTITTAVQRHLQRTGARKLALAGGVFANVALNRKLAELPNVDEVFICPAMGDEGIALGGIYDFLLQRDGWDAWNKRRRRIDNVYWGGAFDDEAAALFNKRAECISRDNPADVAAKLLADGKIVAIYQGRMEFGPRALGNRSILASPVDSAVNQTLNDRLARTEFMPFAPYVLDEDADDVFALTQCNRYAAKFMTITCKVHEKWRDKIPAVVHVDGTARPQIIQDQQNPLYADVLRKFKQLTGLPVLINTSFNAHEEPLIYTPQQCLRALNAGRVDYVLLAAGVYGK